MANRRPVPDEVRNHAKQLRRKPTEAEVALWQYLRGKKLGVRFHRQYPMFGFIADFFCSAARLVVEVDGFSHVGRENHDTFRDQVMRARGVRVLRFTNDDVFDEPETVVALIREAIVTTPTI